jgi:dihydropteroate synthase
MTWKTRRGTLDLTHDAQVMGILNVTPDSFSDGGNHYDVTLALDHARKMIADGAALIDVGGESTRPGATPVAEEEEIRRTSPVITALRAEWNGLISIDTTKAGVARAAIAAGADILNDVSGLTNDQHMVNLCIQSGCGVVVMHRQGDSQTMQVAPSYKNVIDEVHQFFQERYDTLTTAGISPDALCFDPGIGFGKNIDHNLTLIRSLKSLSVENRPLMLGVSRKSFIGRILDDHKPDSREWPTVAITSLTREMGVMLHRVHSVRRNYEALRMTEAILGQTQVPEA